MLGETEYFDEFAGGIYDLVATVLLCAYLVLLTIMMLNLLVAVLSTAHAAVQENADREYKVRRSTRFCFFAVGSSYVDGLQIQFSVRQLCRAHKVFFFYHIYFPEPRPKLVKLANAQNTVCPLECPSAGSSR